MPHDKNGLRVEVGDEVIVRFRVTSVIDAEEYCNVGLESLEGMPPAGHKTTLSAINTRQVEKVQSKGSSQADGFYESRGVQWVSNR